MLKKLVPVVGLVALVGCSSPAPVKQTAPKIEKPTISDTAICSYEKLRLEQFYNEADTKRAFMSYIKITPQYKDVDHRTMRVFRLLPDEQDKNFYRNVQQKYFQGFANACTKGTSVVNANKAAAKVANHYIGEVVLYLQEQRQQ